MIGFLDGVFVQTCRPQADGYRGAAQAAAYDGYKHAHGFNNQVRGRAF